MSADSNTNDKEYLSRLRDDDQEAYKHLFYQHFEMLALTGQHMSGDHDTGREIAQRVMLRLWENRHRLEIDQNLPGYLKRMAINEALAMKRTEARRLSIREGLATDQSEPAQAEANLEADDMQAAIHSAVEGLPDKCREVFKLSRFEGLSYREISETLDISTRTVENHVGRALSQLRDRLSRYL